MNKVPKSEKANVVCSINPNILKQLGLAAQIKNALVKAGKSEKSIEPPTQVTQEVVEKSPEGKTLCPEKKIQVIKQETIDPNLTTTILQTLPNRYTHIIEGRHRNQVERHPKETFDYVLPGTFEQNDFVETLEEVESGEKVEKSPVPQSPGSEEEGVLIDIDYIVEEEVFCDEESFAEDFPKESPIIFLESQENPEVTIYSQEIVQEEVITEETLQADEVDVPEVEREVLDKTLSDSEESFKGFPQSPEETANFDTQDSLSRSHEDEAEHPQIVEEDKEESQGTPVYPAKRFRSLSDTIVSIRSRLPIHKEAEKLTISKKPVVLDPESSDFSEDSSEDSSDSDTSAKESEVNFLLKYVDKNRLVKDILERERKILDSSMMVDPSSSSDLDTREVFDDDAVTSSSDILDIKKELEILNPNSGCSQITKDTMEPRNLSPEHRSTSPERKQKASNESEKVTKGSSEKVIKSPKGKEKILIKDPETLNQSIESCIPANEQSVENNTSNAGSSRKKRKLVPKVISQITENPEKAASIEPGIPNPHPMSTAGSEQADESVTSDRRSLRKRKNLKVYESVCSNATAKKRKQSDKVPIEEQISAQQVEVHQRVSPERELIGFPEESQLSGNLGSGNIKVVAHIKPDPEVRVKVEKATEDVSSEEPRRSGRSKRISVRVNDLFEKPVKVQQNEQTKKKKTNIEFVVTDVSATDVPCNSKAAATTGTVTCGRCQETMPTGSWHKHYLSHNGVTWRCDLDSPIDVNDEQTRARVMQLTIKKYKLGFVRCEKCSETRKSGVGLVSHERTCGMSKEDVDSAMMECEYCNRRVLPCSMKTHQTNHCRELKRLQAEALGNSVQPDSVPVKPEYSDAGRVKRRSTKVAEENFQRARSPHDESFAGSGSDASFGSESSDSDGSSGASERSFVPSDVEDGDTVKKRKKDKKKKVKKKKRSIRSHSISTVSTKVPDERVRGPFCNANWKYMTEKQLKVFYRDNIKEFREKNHSTQPLFTEWSPRVVACEDFGEYLPKCHTSIYYDQLNVRHYKVAYGGASSNTMTTLECFEGVANGKNPPIIFCGAPILAFDWLINPPGGEILAVSCASSFRSNYAYNHTTPEKTVIQIWSCSLGNDSQDISFLYGIAFDWGPAFTVKFCPSGGYAAPERLGLLAVSSCIGNIIIYSLPVLSHKKIIKLLPSLVLQSRQINLISSMAWSEMHGHTYLAAGASTGKAFVWKLDVESSLLKRKKDNIEIIYPMRTINAHIYPITVIFFSRIPTRNLLLTGSIDKDLRIFDLQAGGAEISLLNYKSQITCGAWPLNWPVYMFGIDNTYQWARTEGIIKHPFNVPLEDTPLLVHTQDLTDLDISDWGNVVIVGLESGDICGNFRQHYGPLPKKGDQWRRILSYTDSIVHAGNSNAINDSFSFGTNSLGILFCDLNKTVDLKATKVFRNRHVSEYPLTRINKVAFNPNEMTSEYYAIGYQAGFVRLCRVVH